VLSGTTESGRRLSYDHGQWSLETSELVRLDRNLYRPEKRRIDGTDAILAHLRSRGEGALLSAAERLIRVSDADGSTYEAHEGEWVESEPSFAPGRPSRSQQLVDEMSELRAELSMLRAAYAGVVERLRKLERSSDAAARTRPTAAEPPAAPEPMARGGLRLPPGEAVVAVLRKLIGETLELDEVSEHLPADESEFADLDTCLFRDESGNEVAAALSNLRGTVECGGLLLGVPLSTIEEQVRAGEAETDLLLGMNEVFTNLVGMLNREPGNSQLTSVPVTKAPISRVPWLTKPSSILAFATPMGGRVWLIAR
jgi:hypothetical protein